MKKVLLLLCLFFVSSAHAENHLVDNWQKAQNLARLIEKQCNNDADFTSDLSVNGSLNAADKKIICLRNHINKEIEKSYNKDLQTDMKTKIDNIILVWDDFYSKYYYSNKYCQEHCGSIGAQLKKGKLFTVLQNILTDLIYLNLNKDPI